MLHTDSTLVNASLLAFFHVLHVSFVIAIGVMGRPVTNYILLRGAFGRNRFGDLRDADGLRDR